MAQRLLRLLIPYRVMATASVLAALAVTGVNLYTPQLMRILIDEGITPRDWNGILLATGGLVTVALFRGGLNFIHYLWAETVSQNVAYDLRNSVFDRLQTLSFSYHDKHQTGELMTRATSDIEAVRGIYNRLGIVQALVASVTLLGSVVILFATDARLALVTSAVIPVIALVFGYLFSIIGPRFGRIQAKLGGLNTILQESIAGVSIVKAFAAEDRERIRYRKSNDELYDENIGIVRLTSLAFPFVFFLSNVGTVVVIWVGGERVIQDTLSLGTLIAFNTYLAYLIQPIFQLGFIAQQLTRGVASAKRVHEVLDADNTIVDAPNAKLAPAFKGSVTFEQVSFQYLPTTAPVLDNVSFHVEPGQTIAITGATGSGKSSIINLLPRFYDPTVGRVRIDGQDIRNYTLESLRQQIGVVLQDVNLISGTIADNIAFGKPEATEQEIIEIAKVAQAHDFILQQPDGYNTVVGERGVGLSGGQKQRIAIARALLVDPRIIILDDSTSALDAETESKILDAFERLLADRTAFIIAQRQSTVQNADRVFIVENGRLTQQGPHEELLDRNAFYRNVLCPSLVDDSTRPVVSGAHTHHG